MIKLFLVLSLLQVPTIDALFKAGDKAMGRKDWAEASHNFNMILNEYGDWVLNDIGLTTCYWNIHIAEKNMGHEDESSSALLGFITYGDDVMKDGSIDEMAWAMKFRLREKLHYSYALLQARWARGNSHSCRSNRFACHIKKEKLIDVFRREMPFCGGGKIIETKKVKENNVIIVSVLCDKGSEYYYFKVAE